jgi:hypothetical protein
LAGASDSIKPKPLVGPAVEFDATQDIVTVKQIDGNRVVVHPYEWAHHYRSETEPRQLTLKDPDDFGEIATSQFRNLRSVRIP